MRYHFFAQQSPDWSLAACLEAVVKLRKFFEPSQLEITTKIGTDDSLYFAKLQELLEHYRLNIRHTDCPLNQEEVNALLKTELNPEKDILVCRTPRHFSLVEQYVPPKVTLLDPAQKPKKRLIVSLDELVKSMPTEKDSALGFYIIKQIN